MGRTTESASHPLSREEFLRVAARRMLVALASFGGGLLVDFVWARLVRGVHLERERYPKLVLGRYRIHHNVVGYAAILAGFFWHPLILLPFGLGMIVGHSRRDRLIWFVERVR